MESKSSASAGLPVAPGERIQALDVVRGFALLGIFLMNIEWFNRPLAEMSQGLPLGAVGVDRVAGWLIYVLVAGKFWTIFSLLFGMGFAVMLTRAERAGRNFLRPYLRRIAALAIFGAAHHILLWGGDILFSYAMGAVALLILLYGHWKYLLIAIATLVVVGSLTKFNALFGIAGGLFTISLAALWLRTEKRITVFKLQLPAFSVVVLALGILLTLITVALWVMPKVPMEGKTSMSVISIVALVTGVLLARGHQQDYSRLRRLGVFMYLLPFLLMTTFGALQYFRTSKPVTAAPTAQANPGVQPSARGQARSASQASNRTSTMERRQEEVWGELLSHFRGTFRQALRYRAHHFVTHARDDIGFAIIVVGMFLLGTWFVRAGVLEDIEGHRRLFLKLAWIGTPVGVGLGLIGALFCSSSVAGQSNGAYQFASGLMMLGNLPASLGYVSVIILMLHSDTVFSKVRILAPAGRMALTNYLFQSLLCSLVFFGYGLGHWGMGRAHQVLFVVVVFAFQIALSHLWLRSFRFGPMEWLWRAITYWEVPAIRGKSI